MHKIIGVVLLVAGAFLLVRGHDLSRSLISQVKNLAVGSPSEKVTQLYLAGAICCAVGMVLVFFWPAKK